MPMDSDFTRKDYFNDHSHRRCFVAYKISSKRYSNISEQVVEQLGSGMYTFQIQPYGVILMEGMDREKNGFLIQKDESCQPAVTIWVGSSDNGWGVHSSYMTTNGFWSQDERALPINSRELLTILFALQLHAKCLRTQPFEFFHTTLPL